MFVLGDAGAGILVVSGDAQDDDATLLDCLERVSYVNAFLCHSCFTSLILWLSMRWS
jgi:hypothetical protein